ncbi:chromosomal replication initiator protein DnaA [Buchnera aphidicola]|uniref:Chromosomal replication initiator protein DnaA n=1 Tax=Buchnera aphidicola subsp. Cinara cedri (strain Cc) TaxID=372461 RepID=DNAA_BUCCC|nr:chromosomal replication initiator protein DnaA [Buchnera aphidicola]Q058F9.1 RecName: Full=Chromosomal replication initiator protein DnaA [Buchnera aphidicola BCc]ABJ90490.1 chromosomal replication initiator protein [Buchnera aphidicola BCc]
MIFPIWKKCLIQLQIKLSPVEFSLWILPLKVTIKNNIIYIYTPNLFIFRWIKKKYVNIFKKILYKICSNNPPKIIINIEKKKLEKKKCIYKKKNIQIYLHSEINKKYQFHNFIQGQSNQLAYYSSYKFTKNLKNFYNPLFLYGNTGLGKTHLLHAIGNKFLIKNKKKKVIYIHSENFIQNMVNSLKNNSIDKFKNYYRSIDVLLLDDIQFFSNKKKSQEELFNTFNTLFNKQQKIVLTADCYPEYISGITEQLKSRFKWGLTISINPPELKTRIKILLHKAYENKILLSYEVAKYIAKKIFSNVRELEGILKKIQILSILNKEKITINLVKKILNKIKKKKKNINIIYIQKIVAKYFNIRISDMISQKRSQSIVHPRQIAMTLAKKLTHYSFSEIGTAFGKKDHTTVLYAYKKINQLKKKKTEIYSDFIYLFNQLNA